MFTRGQTQVLTLCTLGTLGDAQELDTIFEEKEKRYIHHYNFPSFSVGETRPSRGPGRREIGHGALAERALLPVIPSVSEFPYALRLVSEVISSNGSTSQGSVCGSTLALMDAGVVITQATLALTPGDPEAIRARMEELMARRKKSQPLEWPSAGSTFKRPTGYFAGPLIEQAGLKGFSVGGAQVSEKHAGFVINRGGATCADVRALIGEVQRRVQERAGVLLEPEVKFVEK